MLLIYKSLVNCHSVNGSLRQYQRGFFCQLWHARHTISAATEIESKHDNNHNMIIRRCLSRHIAQPKICRPAKRRFSTAAMTDEERMEMDKSIKKYSQMPQKQ